MFGIAKRKLLVVAAALGAAAFSTSHNNARAAVATLTSNNSSLSFNILGAANSWVVDGTDQFGGSLLGGDLLEYFNGSAYLPLTTLNLESSNVSGNIGTATFGGTLDGDQFTVGLKFILLGGAAGSGASAINETVTVNNLGPAIAPGVQQDGAIGAPVDFLIRDTFNANLNATADNDTLTLSPSGTPNTANQTDPTGVKLTYATTTTPSSFALISNGVSSSSTGPETGDEAFQFVWDLSLAPGDTGIISNTISLTGASSTVPGVPLPNSAASALATLAGLGIICIVRRKRAAM